MQSVGECVLYTLWLFHLHADRWDVLKDEIHHIMRNDFPDVFVSRFSTSCCFAQFVKLGLLSINDAGDMVSLTPAGRVRAHRLYADIKRLKHR